MYITSNVSHMVQEALTDFSSQHQYPLTTDSNVPPFTFLNFCTPFLLFFPNNGNKVLIKLYLQISTTLARCSSV